MTDDAQDRPGEPQNVSAGETFEDACARLKEELIQLFEDSPRFMKWVNWLNRVAKRLGL